MSSDGFDTAVKTKAFLQIILDGVEKISRVSSKMHQWRDVEGKRIDLFIDGLNYNVSVGVMKTNCV